MGDFRSLFDFRVLGDLQGFQLLVVGLGCFGVGGLGYCGFGWALTLVSCVCLLLRGGVIQVLDVWVVISCYFACWGVCWV